MAKQIINIGTSVNKGDGDPLRTAFQKINENFSELYAGVGAVIDLSAVDQHIIPATDSTYDLGAPDKQWRSLYVSTDTIYIDNTPITVSNNTLVVGDVDNQVTLATIEDVQNIPKGDTGATGPAGPTGATGSQGPVGPQGTQGIQGNTGPQGAKGDTGDTGLQGPTGATGPQGATGAQGATGLQGPKGDTGDQGPAGATGPQGDTGPAGPTGPTGPSGADGNPGATGPAGATGAQGATGPAGAQGAPGAKGDKGDTGAQGVSVTLQGTKALIADLPTPGVGDDFAGHGWIVTEGGGDLWFWNLTDSAWNNVGPIVGPQGDQGPQGDPGSQGAEGPQGDPGPAGNDGADGAQGDPGPQGAEGPAGPQGPAGDTGPEGPEGPQGSAGAEGPQGEPGPAGAEGPQGPAGAEGPQGPAGADGAQGDPGADALWNWQGEYNAEPQYQEGDIVAYQGSTYRRNGVGNSVVGYVPTDITYWELVSAKGADGTGGDGGGLSITDFGEGFTDSLDAGKITTSKLYNENPNPGLNNLYVLEVTNGGVVVLPDQSIINGATLKTVAGNYAGITAGPASPAGKDEDSWMWVDNNGATIATKYSTDAHTWTFNNDGDLTLPAGGAINNTDGITLVTDRGTLAIGTNMEGIGVAGHFHIAFDGSNFEANANDLFLGDDYNYVKLPGYELNPTAQYGVEIGTERRSGPQNIEVDTVDELVPPGGVWRFFIDHEDYPNLGSSVSVGDTVTTSWGTPITATITDVVEEPGNWWKIHVAQDITAGFSGGGTVSFGVSGDSHTWRFGTDGDLAIPPGKTIRDAMTGNDLLDIKVVRQDTAPTAANGTLWFNTVEGRLYIKYSDQWVDAAPLVQPPPDTDIDVNSITFPDASVQTSAYVNRLDNGDYTALFSEDGRLIVSKPSTNQSYFNLVPIKNENNTYGVQIDIDNQAGWTFLDNGTLTLPGGQQIGGSDSTQGIALTTDRGTVLFGNTPEQCVPTQSSHFHIMRDDPTTVDLFFGDDFNYVKLPYDSTLTNVGVQIGTDATNLWSFGKDGNLTVPGDILSEGNINIDINLSDSTLRRWQFGEDGNLTLPAGGDILDINGNSLLNGGDGNIWIQEFETSLGAADVPALTMSVEYLANGDVIALIVHSEDTGGGYTGSYSGVARFTPNGTQVWSMSFKGTAYTNGWGLAVDNDSGHIYVAGWAIAEGFGPYNIATLTKLDTEDGSINWSKSYDVGYENSNTVVDVASDGSPVIVGFANNDTDNQVVTTKINAADGSVTWSRALDGQGNEEAYGMAVGASGEVVSVGYMAQLGEDTDDQMLVVRYLSDGTIDWQKSVTVEEGYDCKGADADIDSQGNIYVCGNFNYENFGQGFQAMIIIKFNSSGVKQWTRKLIGPCADFAASIVVGPDNYLYLSGITIAANEETTKMVLAKYDTDGGVEWQRLLTNTTESMFAGDFFVQLGGGSNLAVRNGYVAVGGGFGDIENFPEIQPNALVAQVDSAGTIFAVGNYEFTPSGFSGTLDAAASDITVVDAAKTDSDYINEFTITDFDPDYDLTSDLIGTLYYGNVGGDDRLTNGANELVLESTGTLTLPQGGTISEGVVTSNPTIQLTPATPAVASQKLVIKGGGNYSNTENGITVTVNNITQTVGDVINVYVESVANADQTLYWWIYPEGVGLSTPSTGTVILDEFGDGNFTFELDSDDYEFTVRVSPEDNNYDPDNTGAESVLINSSAPTYEGEHHLHLTTGDLAVTSIILGTDDHNVRTTTNGKIQITTPGETNKVWEFDTTGDLTIPGNIRSEGNIDIEINLSDSTLRRWTFGEDGGLAFPDATVQTTAWTGIPGPYADDEAAALAGVALGSPYHKTGTGGQVFVRLTSPT